MEKRDHGKEGMDCIDKGLEDTAQITIEDGVKAAIKRWEENPNHPLAMSPEEGEECLEAYRRAFHGE